MIKGQLILPENGGRDIRIQERLKCCDTNDLKLHYSDHPIEETAYDNDEGFIRGETREARGVSEGSELVGE